MSDKTILVADDDPCDLRAVERVFTEAGVLNSLHFVRDGVEVVRYLDGEGVYADRARYPYPEILLLDLKMPKKSGLEVLEWIRNRPEHYNLGVIVLTAVEDIRQLREAYQLGAHSFLTKPLSVEELMNLLRGLKGIRLQSNEAGQYLNFDTTFFEKTGYVAPRAPSDQERTR